MSKLWKPSPYKDKCMELQMTNAFMHIHDLACGCNDPLLHTIQLLLSNKIDSTIPESTKEKIKCLLSTEAGFNHGEGDTPEDIADVLTAGDLEELFKENTEDDDG